MPSEQLSDESPALRHGVMDLIVDDFEEFRHQPCARDPLGWPDYPEKLERARKATGSEQSVTAGRANAGGHPCIVIAFNFAFMGGSMGEAEGQRIGDALTLAAGSALPVVSVLGTGGARMQEGMRSLIQMQRIAEGLAGLAAAGIPHVCVATHPTTGGVWASLGAAADFIIGAQGATVAFAGFRARGEESDSEAFTAEGKWDHGFIDTVEPLEAVAGRLALVVELLSPATRGSAEPPPLPNSLGSASPLTGWEQVRRARSAVRPRAEAYLDRYFAQRLEIRGDRVGGVDSTVQCGFGRREGRTVAFVSQSGSLTTAAGYRTAQRLLRLASRLSIPVLALIDSPGSVSTASGEEAGVGTAIAELLQTVATTSVPIVSVVIGEGGSGGSLALASPENLWITPDGYFSVIAPEVATAILKKPAADVPSVARQLRLAPDDLLELGVVRGVLRPLVEVENRR